jgi:predicted esterase
VPYDYDVSRVAAYGHSMGGAALANAMITDERFAGVINMDGWYHVELLG